MTAALRDVVDRFVRHYDYLDPEFTPEVAEIVNRKLRETPGVPYSPVHGGLWILARYEQVRAALKDHRTFSSAAGVFHPRPAGTPAFSPIEFDPPEHRNRRGLMTPPLLPEQVRRLEPAMKTLAAQLIGRIVERGGGDLVAELAKPFAVGVLGLAIGLSERTQHEILELTGSLWRHLAKERDLSAFWPSFHRLVAEEVAEARRRPGRSYLSRLAATEVGDETLRSIVVSLFIAGHQTSVNAVSRMLWQLARDPAVRHRVAAEPAPRAVAAEETLRRWCPTDRFTRVTTRDVTIDGTPIQGGSRVLLLIDSANRDPAKFPDPDAFRLDRGTSHQHLSFGFGIHHCLGASLARLQLRTVLAELTAHPPYHLTEEPRPYLENGRNTVFPRLPVEFR